MRQIRSHLSLTLKRPKNGQGVGGLTEMQEERVGMGSHDRGYGHRNEGDRDGSGGAEGRRVTRR